MLIWRICPPGQPCDLIEDQLIKWLPSIQVSMFSQASFPSLSLMEKVPNAIFISLTGQAEAAFTWAEQLQREFGPINLIFTADCPDYAYRAIQCRASGYLLEPLQQGEVFRELANLRFDVGGTRQRRIRIRTFGNFDVWVDGKILRFPRANAKELLAYLVDRRGGSCTLGEIAAVLWEDKERGLSLNSQIQTTVSTLTRVLREAGVGELLVRFRNAISICCDMVSCDLYDFLDGKAAAFRAYSGEYMRNYSWAEYTAGWLNDYAQRRRNGQIF